MASLEEPGDLAAQDPPLGTAITNWHQGAVAAPGPHPAVTSPEACCLLPFTYIICDSFMLPGAHRLTALTLSICHQHPPPPSISLPKGTLKVFMFYSLKNSFHLDMICMFLWDKPSFRRGQQQRERKNKTTGISLVSTFQPQFSISVHVRVCVCVHLFP